MSPQTVAFVRDDFTNFDPNKLTAGSPVWATFDGGKFKTYAKRGPALNAVMHHHRTKLYRLVNGRWDLVAVKDGAHPPDDCSICGGSIKVAADRYKTVHGHSPYYYGPRGWEWQRMPGSNKIADPPVLLRLCIDCMGR